MAVGCVKCGREGPPESSVWAQCDGCGKVVGICVPCARVMPGARQFVDESLEWHQERACQGPLNAAVDRIMAAMRGAPAPAPRPARRSPTRRREVLPVAGPVPGADARARRAAALARMLNQMWGFGDVGVDDGR